MNNTGTNPTQDILEPADLNVRGNERVVAHFYLCILKFPCGHPEHPGSCSWADSCRDGPQQGVPWGWGCLVPSCLGYMHAVAALLVKDAAHYCFQGHSGCPSLSFLKGRSADLQELDEPDRKLLSMGKAGIKRGLSSNIIVDRKNVACHSSKQGFCPPSSHQQLQIAQMCTLRGIQEGE